VRSRCPLVGREREGVRVKVWKWKNGRGVAEEGGRRREE